MFQLEERCSESVRGEDAKNVTGVRLPCRSESASGASAEAVEPKITQAKKLNITEQTAHTKKARQLHITHAKKPPHNTN